MKLSEKTLGFLKNVANINRSITINPGNVIRTMGPDKEIMMRVQVEENFEQTIRIFELSRLLGVVSMFEDADLDFQENCVLVTGKDGGEVKYMYAAEEVCPKALTKDPALPDVAVEFTLSSKDLAAIMKAASVLSVPDISVIGDGENMKLVAHDKSIQSSDKYAINLGTTDAKFSLDFKVEKMKLIPSDYDVRISSKKISHFRSDALDVDYWIGLEYSSKFE